MPISKNVFYKKSEDPVDYHSALQFMEHHVSAMKRNEADQLIWFLEHPSLYSGGPLSKKQDLLTTDLPHPLYLTNRGGQYTYHGPGQRIVYIMLDIKRIQNGSGDLRLFIKQIQEWIILSLKMHDIEAFDNNGLVGVWIQDDDKIRKIASIGIRATSWITYHGVAINLHTDLKAFSYIRPCGLDSEQIASASQLGVKIDMNDYDISLIRSFEQIFNVSLQAL